jgi:hypothetical protein
MKEYQNGILMIDEIIRDWKNNKLDNRKGYHETYKNSKGSTITSPIGTTI